MRLGPSERWIALVVDFALQLLAKTLQGHGEAFSNAQLFTSKSNRIHRSESRIATL
jgi:hypothetical protein